tara:strand:+ start:5205 stop:7841 length:2637 start_codon:yes stop_codon:yes gene_type:complete
MLKSSDDRSGAQGVPRIPDYEFPGNAVIGEGAYGKVWYGIYKEDQPRAVKVFKPEALRRDRWKAEYQKLKELDEPPGIVTLYDQGETEDGQPFVAMRLMANEAFGDGSWSGRTLQEKIESGELTMEGRWKLVFEIADTLAYLQRQGVVHCDVKPSNVLLSGGDEPRAVLCDFGQSIEEGYSPDGLTGTLLYASPEQLRGVESVIERWDVYSFGVTAFQLLTGRLPRLDMICEDLKTEDGKSVLQRTVASYLENSLMLKASIDRELVPLVIEEAIKAERVIEMPTEILGSEREDDFHVILACLALEGDPVSRYSGMTAAVSAFHEVARKKVVRVEKRKKTIYATLMVFGLLAAGVAGWQWFRAEGSRVKAEQNGDRAALAAIEQQRLAGVASLQRDEAETQRTNAEAQAQIAGVEKEHAIESEKVALLARSTAEVLINNMLYDLKNQLEPLGRLDLLEQVSEDAGVYFEELPESQRTDESERERSTMLVNRGEVKIALGEYDQALNILSEARDVRSQLLGKSPDSAQSRRDLSVILERIGDVKLLQGDLAASEKNYRECLEIRKALEDTSADPKSSRKSIRDVGVAQMKLSDVLARKGDVNSSIEVADSSLERFRILSSKLGDAFRSQRDLGVALLRCGDLYLQNAVGEGALKYYEESADILGGLISKASPDDTAVRRDYSAALVRMGVWYTDGGEAEVAVGYFETALPVVRKLASLDPENLDRTRNLALLLGRMGEAKMALGELAESSECFRESSVIFGRLTEHSEPQPIWLDDAQTIFVGWGDLLAHNKEWSRALARYSESLYLARRRNGMAQSDEQSKTNLVVSLYKVANAIRESEDDSRKAEAISLLRESLRVLDELGGDTEDWEEVLQGEIRRN